MRSSSTLIAAIVLMALGAGLATTRWIHEPRLSTAAAGPDAGVCRASDAPGSNCELPKTRALTIGSVPVAALEVAFYGAVAALLLLALLGGAGLQREVAGMALRLIMVGVVADIVLLGLQLFVRHDACPLCLATYATTFLSAALLRPPRRLGPAPLARTDPAERRMLLGGWTVATVVVLVAVSVGELGLRERRHAQDLQATLDSPAKRDAYDADQAVVKFYRDSVHTFDLSAAPRLGAPPPDGPIVVVEFVDYLCPFCKQLYGGLDQFLGQQHGRVTWYFKNLPLDTECNPTLPENYHPGACWLARGAVCAKDAGKWLEYYRAAFSTELTNPGPAEVTRLGVQAGLGPVRFGRCLQSEATIAAVAADVAESVRAKAQGTPTLFINGRRAPLWTYIERLVTAESERLKLRSQ